MTQPAACSSAYGTRCARQASPYRLHWGKFQPAYTRGDRTWVDFFRAQYPRWDDFLALRERRDPNNVVLNAYWRDRFGLWDAPPPRPQP
jgi:D-arabinono-1,4-lactone oxidase